MRFTKKARFAFVDTSRKRAAVLVSQRRAREKLPLFGELIAEEQPEVDAVMEARARHWIARERTTRTERATLWWAARARLNRLPEPQRTAFLSYWNRHRWLPGDPTYLAGELHSFEVGRLILHDGKIVYASELEWQANRDAKIAAMTDAELDHLIQTHISMQFVELGRAERQRRAGLAPVPVATRDTLEQGASGVEGAERRQGAEQEAG